MMANQQEQIVPYPEVDYEDRLEPGYRFSPTDSEIIVYYLKPHIETGEHPKCRLYQVDIYKHTPDELAERYRPCDNKWYFLTPRERKYDNGDRPNRITKDSGRWKMSQSKGPVYDESRVAVGKKNCFAYHVEKDRKTPWLMHEYTTLDPNLPATGSGQERKKLTDWVICKIYKKEANRSTNKKRAAIRNQEDEPSPIRPRLSVNQGINVPNEALHIQIQEINQHLGTEVQMVAHANVNQQAVDNVDVGEISDVSMRFSQTVPVYQTRMNTNPQQVDAYEHMYSIQSPVTNPTDVIGRDVDESAAAGNSSNIATNSFYLSDCASTSTSVAASTQPSDYVPMFVIPPPVISVQDILDPLPQPNDFTPFLDEDNSLEAFDWSYDYNLFDDNDGISLEDLKTPPRQQLDTSSTPKFY